MKGKIVFETPWFSIEELYPTASPETGQTTPYYKVNVSRGVVILPVTPGGDFILIRQYRPVLDKMTIEIPAGAIDSGETPERAALREFTEETGYRCKNLIPVGGGVLRIEREDAVNYFYIAQDVEPVAGRQPEPGIELLNISPQDFKELVRNGQFDHIAALSIFMMAEFSHGIKLLDENSRSD